ncbi:MAG: hypothetical protein KGL95_00075 [Patescibacteria group bacterium]|nr:hypothetical protein [Patescibacteria group bacterium]
MTNSNIKSKTKRTTILASVLIGLLVISSSAIVPNVNAAAIRYPPHPPPKLSPSENQTIIDTAIAVPGLQAWSHDWRYVLMGFGSNNNKLGTPEFQWQFASVVLKAPSNSAPIACSNDWRATVVIDMTTMKVVSASYPTIESHPCQLSWGGSSQSNTMSVPRHIGYPPPVLPPSENQTIINTALSIPGLQDWSHDWQFVEMSFLGNNKAGTPDFKWQYAIVSLKAPSNSGRVTCDNDWQAWAEIDMTTMKVVNATYPTMESHNCNYITTGPDIVGIPVNATSSQKQLSNNTQQSDIPADAESPLKQYDSGISARDVICQSFLQLIIKTVDGSPACVTPGTATILIERGWGHLP